MICEQETRSERNERKRPQLERNAEYHVKYSGEHDKRHREK